MSNLPSLKALIKFWIDVAAVSTALVKGSLNFSKIAIPIPSKAELNVVNDPFKFVFIVFAISSAAPPLCSIAPLNSSKRPPVLANKASTAFKSVLLNIFVKAWFLADSLKLSVLLYKSMKISSKLLKLPLAS